ncbi:SusC/RagA family TonB-linked outer membrane protein [Pricia sp. S334]|uniref:SusC/RagA family TonB-linked outer membrane protein n=1 Tax=Pricia mediterranea TaxID=3076079 RepID=A0ABU3L5B3_9FLAO|nr:SusC/RagA family TonB-linked outer membrane protein [Pricia sp. S334]MDT7828297.1 SusC/RagA family TonB-linked outer membrane protein [Pricia sp. S334]
MERDKESLGYSISQVDAEQVNVARENNVMNSLSGKVSGLQITQSNTGVDGSSRVLLRGVTTINGNNRPLVVIDGIPISNDAGGAGSYSGGVDRGDALSDINPDDVASISVLKGAGTSAAYGSLGINGVILITTKSGSKMPGIGVSLNSSFTFTDIALTPDFQNQYGVGFFNDFPPINADGRPVLDYPLSWSWGPKMEGQSYTNWLGRTDSYSPQGNPYKDFYQTGFAIANTIAFEGRSDKGSFRMSITDEDVQGIVSNNTLAKQTFNLRGSSSLTDNFSIDGKMTYLTSKVKNRPDLAEGGGNTALQLALMPRDITLEDVRNNTVNADGEEIKWNLDNTFNNPYWALENIKNTDEKDRFQGFLGIKWDIGEHFDITAKSGMDYIVFDYTGHAARGAQAESNGLGNYSHDSGKSRIWNSDVLATYTTDIGRLKVTGSLGANYRDEFGSNKRINGFDSKVRDFYNISNYKNSFSSESVTRKGITSYYLLGQFSYGGYVYFDASLRNDNSSALPKDNNSYWYHSENMSFLFTKALGLGNQYISKGKLRGSFAKVGNDTSPYRTQAIYNVDQTVTLPYTVGSIPGSLPSFDLRPETSESWEVGVDLGFFENRLLLDLTYYETDTKDQIQAVPISGSSGFGSVVVNAGNITNKGYEFQLNAVPFESESFGWNLGLNFTKSNSKVESLNEGLTSIELNRLWSVSVEARPGEEFGGIYGNDFLRDNFGRKLITDDGLAQRGERIKLGSINPDWYGGISNTLRYKNLSLNTLISVQQGGEFYSYGRAYRMFFGTDARTLPGRETGIVEEGINENTGFDNEVAAPAFLKHFTDIFSNEVAVDQVLDASNVKLREVALTYNFPQKMLRDTFIQSGSLSAIGRNLFFLYNAAGDIDPEAGFSSGPTSTALEHSSLPSTRSYGLNLKLNF